MKRIVQILVLGAIIWLLGFDVVIKTPALINGKENRFHIDHAIPIDRLIYKITLINNGIYELSYDALQTAGMPVDTIDPNSLTLMHRGEIVATQFSGDTDTNFEPGESVRFYGWAFDGSRHEQQFVTENVFWLWADDSSTPIETLPNMATQQDTLTHSAIYTVTTEPENDFFSGWTDQWDSFPNEADAWYWDRLPQEGIGSQGTPYTYTIQLPHPNTNSAETAVFTTEFMSRAKAELSSQVQNEVNLLVNNTQLAQQLWYGRQNINLTGTAPANVLQDGENGITAVITTTDVLYLNRITASYPRLLIAQDGQLIFDGNGSKSWQVSGFSDVSADDFLVWEIGERKRPFHIPILPQHISGTDDIAVTFSIDQTKDHRFIVTTISNLKQPSIQKLNPVSLNPANHQAEWLIITHPSLLEAANRLANYRKTQSGMTTHVATIDDIINQYGYGFPYPEAIRQYLIHAHESWQKPPRYVVLLGDATINPRQLECQWSCTGTGWKTASPSLIPTDLLFVDRYQGLIPTDHTMALLDEDDLIPDVALGRLSARTIEEANTIIDKMIEYEQNQANPANWHQPVLFIADQDDAAGAFCAHNQSTGEHVQTTQKHLCLPTNPTNNELAALQAAMFHTINIDGAWIITYRGHGSMQYWGGGGDVLLSVAEENSSLGAWLNDKPTIIVSGDCLDGHFAWPGVSSISETLLRYPYGGTAAHWSSSGLGHDLEHSILLDNFYDSIYLHDSYRIGDAILDAKRAYAQSQQHSSPLYSFTLQGDPALALQWAQVKTIYLPISQK